MNKIDNIDKKIIDLLYKNPNMTHAKISKKVGRSQPTVGNRIKKLNESGLLVPAMMTNISKTNYIISILFIETNKSEIQNIKHNKHIIHIFGISGEYNILLFIYGNTIKQIDNIIKNISKKIKINKKRVEFIYNFMNGNLLPIEFPYSKE